jgi:hypothetical protein
MCCKCHTFTRVNVKCNIISDLTNDLLEHQRPFDEYLFSMLDGFMKRMPQPVCIIAHNGIKFDFPVLQAELFNIGKVCNLITTVTLLIK